MTVNEGEYKTYLGQDIYADFDGTFIILHDTNYSKYYPIFLDYPTYLALAEYVYRVWGLKPHD